MKRTVIFALLSLMFVACDKLAPTFPAPDPAATSSLSLAEVQMLVARAIDAGRQLGERPFVAVVDREGNILAVYNGRMAIAAGVIPENSFFGSIVRARTAAYLSSNQHAFTSLTACGITREHYPPSQLGTPGGPLYGVTFSQVGGSDVQPNNGTNLVLAFAPRQPGMTGAPGGVPLYKNGALVGGLGVAFCSDDLLYFDINNPASAQCQGAYQSERVARAAAASLGYEAPAQIRADQVYNDGVQLLYSNEALWPVNLANTLAGMNFTLTADSLANSIYGSFDNRFPLRGSLPPFYPNDGYVSGYAPQDGQLLAAAQVDAIVRNVIMGASNTRAEIRRPLGQMAKVSIAVSDLDGTILALYRMADAAIFGIDVSAQKARTAVAFNVSGQALNQQLRNILIAGNTITPGQQIAVTTRTIGFLAQAFYPPGIDGNPPGPFYLDRDFAFQANLGTQPFGNGITIFPGGVPLYMNGALAGAIGISGDGVNQDDLIATLGAVGYEVPSAIRADNFSYRGVQLPFVKFPRQP